jgi:LemA protein
MGTGLIIALCVGGVLLLIVFWAIAAYNGLIVGRNRYKNAFAQIDVQLKRRNDLIPNLVEVVKGYMSHERETLEAVVKARNLALAAQQKAAANPGDQRVMKELSEAEGQVNSTLSRLLMVAEAYPDLKANQNMLSLQEELTSTENKISFARQAFNDAVTAFNNQRQVVPTVIVANLFGFTEAGWLETPATEREAPKVSFNK